MSHQGRNDVCSCGSGKKYKKCCARKEQSTLNSKILLVLVGLLIAGSVAAAVTTFTSDRGHAGRPAGVWSAEHGHYH